MKTLTAIFLLCTFGSFAQQQDEWITPFATVEFKQDKILYYYTPSLACVRLQPLFLPAAVLATVPVGSGISYYEDASVWKPIIREAAEGTNFLGLSRDEKLYFLKAFALQSIWGINQRDEMPSQGACLLVSGLSDDLDTEIAAQAKLAAELYELIRQGIVEMDKMRKKQH